jgi:G3E family GTPase
MSAMLTNIPCHLLAGPLGAGKTSLLRQLLAQRPASERWAVLVNEFGQIGLDAALLDVSGGKAGQGVQIAEIAGGCLCCVNGVPFQVGLNRLLRQARPDRVLIEASGLGHPQQLLQQLAARPWQGVLALQPLVLVLDAAALAAGQRLPKAQQDALPAAGLLLLNKAESLDDAARARLAAQLPNANLYWTLQGALPLERLPGSEQYAQPAANSELPAVPPAPGQLWLDRSQPEVQVGSSEQGWSIGWRWHPQWRFEPRAVEAWLAALDWRRAKLVLQTPDGPQSANALDGSPLEWRPSEWRRDSRLELIFPEARDAAALDAGLRECLCGNPSHQ